MMKKILVLTICLLSVKMSIGQVTSDTLQNDTLSISAHSLFSATNQGVTKADGDSAYIKNDYALAIQVYEALLQMGEAAEVYYNLGNSYYKVDNIAKAILNYERALLLQPGNVDIRANLEIARAKTIDKITPIPEIFFISWTKSLINSFSVDTWAKVSIFFFFLLLASLYFFFFSRNIAWKKSGFIIGIISLVFVVLGNIFAYQQKSELVDRNSAIVLTPSVTVRSTPSETGTSLFILHEGRKVEIKDSSMREWREIRLEDGKVGWVPSSSVEVI